MFQALNRERADVGPDTRYAIRDTERGAPDMAMFATREQRDTVLAELRAGMLTSAPVQWTYTSDERGGHWLTPWDVVDEATPEPAPEPTPTEEVATFRGLSPDEAQRKLRAIITDRNEHRRMSELLQREREAEREAHAQQLSRLRELLTTAQAPISDVSDERLTPIWDKAAEAAEEEGFCPEYDKLCDNLGIPGRERLYRGVVTVTFNAYVFATARSADAAGDAMESTLTQRLAEALPQGSVYSREDGSIADIDVNDSEVEDVSVY